MNTKLVLNSFSLVTQMIQRNKMVRNVLDCSSCHAELYHIAHGIIYLSSTKMGTSFVPFCTPSINFFKVSLTVGKRYGRVGRVSTGFTDKRVYVHLCEGKHRYKYAHMYSHTQIREILVFQEKLEETHAHIDTYKISITVSCKSQTSRKLLSIIRVTQL